MNKSSNIAFKTIHGVMHNICLWLECLSWHYSKQVLKKKILCVCKHESSEAENPIQWHVKGCLLLSIIFVAVLFVTPIDHSFVFINCYLHWYM